MKKTLTLLLSAIFVAAMLVSCGSKDKKEKKVEEPKTEVKEEVKVDKEAMMAKGAEIYTAKCAVCHMPNGEGLAGAFPPLANSDYLLAYPVKAVDMVINGYTEPLTVNGVEYTTAMAAVDVTKEEALVVVNYTLQSFGNSGKMLTMDDIKDVVKK